MEWQALLAILLVIPIILFPAVFVWYLNAGGLYAAIRERKGAIFAPLGRFLRRGFFILTPVVIYAVAVAISATRFGWQVALAVGLVLPVILLAPVLVWAAAASGLYLVVRDAMRHRVTAPRHERLVVETVRRD